MYVRNENEGIGLIDLVGSVDVLKRRDYLHVHRSLQKDRRCGGTLNGQHGLFRRPASAHHDKNAADQIRSRQSHEYYLQRAEGIPRIPAKVMIHGHEEIRDGRSCDQPHGGAQKKHRRSILLYYLFFR